MTENKRVRTLLLLLTFLTVSCGSDQRNAKLLPGAASMLGSVNRPPDTTIQVEWGESKRTVQIIPAETFFSKGTILLLHGWNLSPSGWCEQTTLCEKLRSEGYNIVVPDMGKSMYASAVYPETMQTMAEQPQKAWLSDTVLVLLRDSFGLFNSQSDNFLVGLSTGARGAFAIGLQHPEMFRGAVLLSGDYDQTLMPDDALMTYYYGNYDQFPERWEGEDNLLLQANRWQLPLYIGHAIDDPVVPCEQSVALAQALKEAGKVKPVSHFPENYGHDYRYWESETEAIIKFILSTSEQRVVVN